VRRGSPLQRYVLSLTGSLSATTLAVIAAAVWWRGAVDLDADGSVSVAEAVVWILVGTMALLCLAGTAVLALVGLAPLAVRGESRPDDGARPPGRSGAEPQLWLESEVPTAPTARPERVRELEGASR